VINIRNTILAAATLAAMSAPAFAQEVKIKTRLDHLSGTQWVLVVSTLPAEIESITCERWTMLGVNSWKHHNDFTIPVGPSVAILDADKFDGYCKTENSIVAHTDDGDYVGFLDNGAGNWDASTKLVFNTSHKVKQ